MMAQDNHRSGFTIVELLIVIVVIAILATISIVAYNGIQNKARVSSVSSSLVQASKKILLWQADNPDSSPSSLATVGVANTSSTTFQYTPGAGGAFCITATNGSVSYMVTESTQPASGSCSGHELAVTNYAQNPSVESNSTGWGRQWGTGGGGTVGQSSAASRSGSAAYRMTWSAAPTGGAIWSELRTNIPNAGGKTYTASVFVRPSWGSASFALNLVPFNSAGTYLGTETTGTTVAGTANAWTRVTATFTMPANTAFLDIRVRYMSGTLPGIGDTMDTDAAFIGEGSTVYNYADGNSTNWIWNGAANNSTSTGPSL